MPRPSHRTDWGSTSCESHIEAYPQAATTLADTLQNASFMNSSLRTLLLAAYSLRFLAAAQHEERRVSLDDIVDGLGMARSDVRAGLSQLHTEGLLDVATMRLSLEGFACGRALARVRLSPLTPVLAHAVAA